MTCRVLILVLLFASIKTFAQNSSQSATQKYTRDSTVAIKVQCGTSMPDLPLYIVNGKIKDAAYFTDLDPNSVESVRILKGDKAVKKYGKKGKNGVIIVAIKKDVLL